MDSILASLFLFALAYYCIRRAVLIRRAPAIEQENAALRALVDRIDRLADDSRDLPRDPSTSQLLSIQVLDEIRAHRRRTDGDRLGIPAHSSISRVAPRAAAETARAVARGARDTVKSRR